MSKVVKRDRGYRICGHCNGGPFHYCSLNRHHRNKHPNLAPHWKTVNSFNISGRRAEAHAKCFKIFLTAMRATISFELHFTVVLPRSLLAVKLDVPLTLRLRVNCVTLSLIGHFEVSRYTLTELYSFVLRVCFRLLRKLSFSLE